MNITINKNLKDPTAGNVLKKPRPMGTETVMLLLFFVLFYLFIFSPKNADLKQKRAERDLLLTEQQSVSAKISLLKSLIAKMQNNPKELAFLDEALPLDNRITKLQLALVQMADASGLSGSEVSVSGAPDEIFANPEVVGKPFAAKRNLKIMNATANVSGSYEQLKAFLERIETSGRLIDIKTFDILPVQIGLLDMKLSMQAYYFAP